MKFSDLSVGDRFEFWERNSPEQLGELTKLSDTTYKNAHDSVFRSDLYARVATLPHALHAVLRLRSAIEGALPYIPDHAARVTLRNALEETS